MNGDFCGGQVRDVIVFSSTLIHGGPLLGSSIQGLCVVQKPGEYKGRARLPVSGLREHSCGSALSARVPTAFDGIQQRFKVGFAMPVVDLAGGANVVPEKLRRHDEIGAVAADMAVKGLFDADRTVASLNVDLA